MNRSERPSLEEAPVRRARSVEELERLLAEPGAVVEVDPDLAEAVGAMAEDCIDAEEAYAAAWDPATYGYDWNEGGVE